MILRTHVQLRVASAVAAIGIASIVLGVARLLAASQQPTVSTPLPELIVPRTWLVLAPVDASGRRPFRPDAVFAKHLLDRDATAPTKDETLQGELGTEATWTDKQADENGAIDSEVGWAYTSVDSPVER